MDRNSSLIEIIMKTFLDRMKPLVTGQQRGVKVYRTNGIGKGWCENTHEACKYGQVRLVAL